MDSRNIETIVQEVLTSLKRDQSPQSVTGTTAARCDTSGQRQRITDKDYPLADKRKDLVKTPTNKSLDDITLDAVLKGDIGANDLRITPETLELQAQVAESVGRKSFAQNLRRAAELTRIPDDRILEIYNALRPNRSTKQELLAIAAELKDQYQAHITSAFVIEASEVYERRGILAK